MIDHWVSLKRGGEGREGGEGKTEAAGAAASVPALPCAHFSLPDAADLSLRSQLELGEI